MINTQMKNKHSIEGVLMEMIKNHTSAVVKPVKTFLSLGRRRSMALKSVAKPLKVCEFIDQKPSWWVYGENQIIS